MASSSSVMPDAAYGAAFTVLFQEALRVEPTEELLVIYDETLQEFWQPFLDATVDHGCPATLVMLPLAEQEHLARRAGSAGVSLPIGLQTAISECDVVVTILSGRLDLASVRKALVGRATGPRSPRSRFAHIPGISARVLDVLSRSPLAEIGDTCEALAWAMGEGRQATILTTDAAGQLHRLECHLGSWYNQPLMSPGVIGAGSWGNVPAGESFCCPAPRSVYGTIAINGAIPGHACLENEVVVLEFEAGRVVHWQTPSQRLLDFFERQALDAAGRQDDHWSTFAELGVGANPAIRTLTGNSLFDEKAYGTIHVAIGDNEMFGHTVKSGIHADLVIRNASLIIDGHRVVDAGEIRLDAIAAWREGVPIVPVDPQGLERIVILRETLELPPSNPDTFARRVFSRGRTGYVTIARGRDAAALQRLLHELRDEDHVPPGRVKACAKDLGIEEHELARLLGLLAHYRMANVSPDPLTGGSP